MAEPKDATPGKVVPLKARRCPICRQRTVAEFMPFCSKACADRDLDRWLSGTYRIPSEDQQGDDDDLPNEE